MDGTQSTSGNMDLGDMLALIWRSKTYVVGVAVVAGAVAFAGSMLGPRVYESTVTFAATQSKLGDGGLMVSNTAAFRPMVESLNTASEVIKEVGLDKAPYNLTPSEFLDAIAVTEIRGTSLMTVKITMGDPAMAATVANSVAQHAVKSARRVSASELTYTRDLIKEQLDLVRQRLDQADTQLREFKQQARIESVRKDAEARLGGPQSPALAPTGTSAVKPQQGSTQTSVFMEDRSAGRSGILDLQVRIATERAKVNAIERELAAHKTIDDVSRGLQASASEARLALASLEQQKSELTAAHPLDAGTKTVLDQLYRLESELARRQVERDVAEKAYVELSQRYQDAALQVIGKSAEFVIIDPAVPADRPASRHAARNSVISMLIWMAFAVASVLVWDSMQRRRVQS